MKHSPLTVYVQEHHPIQAEVLCMWLKKIGLTVFRDWSNELSKTKGALLDRSADESFPYDILILSGGASLLVHGPAGQQQLPKPYTHYQVKRALREVGGL